MQRKQPYDIILVLFKVILAAAVQDAMREDGVVQLMIAILKTTYAQNDKAMEGMACLALEILATFVQASSKLILEG